MSGVGIGGVALMGGGFLFLWSAYHGAHVTGSLRDLLAGKQPTYPAPGTGDEQIAGTSGSTSSQGSTSTSAPADGSLRTGAVNGCSAATNSANKATVKLMAGAYGWAAGSHWNALNSLIMSESGYCNVAQNPGSTAYGIFQFLDTTWASTGYTKTSDPVVQIAAGLAYVKVRYITPEKAWAFHMANGWY